MGKIEIVEASSYLVQIIVLEKRTEKEMTARIAKTWAKYWTLKKIFKGPFTTSQKSEIFNICVLLTLTFGCQTWTINETLIKKIMVAQNGLERSMLGMKMKDHVGTSSIKQKLWENIHAARQIRR